MIKWGKYETIKQLRATGMVRTPFKTYRKLPGIMSPSYRDQADAERAGCNAPIQMSGYHVMARGMLRIVQRWAGKPPLRAAFPGEVLFTVHDEIVAQARHDLAEEAKAQMLEEMTRPHPELVGGCGIPRGIPATGKVTDAWGGLNEDDLDALAAERALATVP